MARFIQGHMHTYQQSLQQGMLMYVTLTVTCIQKLDTS